MSSIPFVTLDAPRYGEVVEVAPMIRRVVAENPSKFTYRGTGTYIVGSGEVAVIDPGPQHDAHRDALDAALAGQRVVAILVTHCHADHSPLAAWLRAETGAPTVAFGPHLTPPDADADVDLFRETGDAPARIEESVDRAFVPDVHVADDEVAASGDGWTLTAVHTPGHTANHLCFALAEQRALFTGDHIMGWSTTVIGPPDGDMRAYFDSLHKVRGRDDATFWPTHGAPVTDTRPFLDAFIAHRLDREAQVLAAVRAGASSIKEMVERLYADVRPELHSPASRSVLAHLVKLTDDAVVTTDGGPPHLRGHFHPV